MSIAAPEDSAAQASAVDQPEKTVTWAETVWQHGFTAVPNTILLSLPLTATALRVYMLFIHFSHLPDEKWPGQEGFAEIAQCSERSVRDAVRELEAAQLVQTRRRGLGKTNSYVLLAPRDPRAAKSAGLDRQDLRLLEVPDPAAPSRTRHRSRTTTAKTTAKKGANAPGVRENNEAAPDLSWPPKLKKLDGHNVPLDTLCSELGIDPASPRLQQAIAALNGRDLKSGKQDGIRGLFWIECQRAAEERGLAERLATLHADPERFELLLADRIGRKVKLIRERQPWRGTLTPNVVRELWLDIDNAPAPPAGGYTVEDIRRLRETDA